MCYMCSGTLLESTQILVIRTSNNKEGCYEVAVTTSGGRSIM